MSILTVRNFPFKTTKQTKDIRTALAIFKLLWHAHEKRGGDLTTRNMQPVFHNYVSDALSYADGGWRRGKYWTPEAWKIACRSNGTGGHGLKCEHVIPRCCVLAHAMEEVQEYADAESFVINSSFVCVVTSEENKLLNKAKLAKSHPDVSRPWERYASPELKRPIKVLDIPGFMTESERRTLRDCDLLAMPDGEHRFA